MARFVVSGGILRFPLAGHAQWILGWLVGLHRLGHEVVYVEQAGWPDACFDPDRLEMGDDCSYGVAFIRKLLTEHGLKDRWSFQDVSGRYVGMSEAEVMNAFSTADCYLALWAEWNEHAEGVPLTVLFDAEPGFNQIRMERSELDPERAFDRYYTVGLNVGTAKSSAPTAGRTWHHTLSPVLVSDFEVGASAAEGSYVSIMNWRSQHDVEFEGRTYGQKDAEFAKFMALPAMVDAPMVLSVAGAAPRDELTANGWRLVPPYEPTRTTASYRTFLRGARGYFGVAKNVFVATNSGWFGTDAAYALAAGRPVILQSTGFADHLPTGAGLFAVRDADEAADAIGQVERDYARHAKAARATAGELLDSGVVLGRFLRELEL